MEHRILVIDENQAVATALSRSINSKVACEVHSAADQAEARALLECYSYCLVITDLSSGRARVDGSRLVDDRAVAPFSPDPFSVSGQSNTGLRPHSVIWGTNANVPHPGDQFSDMVRDVINHLDLSTCLKASDHATARLGEFMVEGGTRVFVQPIYRIDCMPATLVAVEFLTHGPSGSLFERPDVLFAYTRAAQTESVFDRHCIRRSLAVAAHLPASVRISVNVHASTLCAAPDFSDWLAAVARSEQIDTHRITLEIIERSPAWNQNTLLRTLARLRLYGVQIAIDDVGLGHSNYQMVVEARPDWLKLDRYFVHGCSTSQYRRAVVASVVRLAADVGAVTIAEGVETAQDLRQLQALGIHFVQGFLFCPPKSVADAFAGVLAESGQASHMFHRADYLQMERSLSDIRLGESARRPYPPPRRNGIPPPELPPRAVGQ